MARKIMIIGLGGLGFDMLQFLARTTGVSEIVTADKDDTNGLFKTQNAIHGASCHGCYPRISFVQMDVSDVANTASVLKQVKPTVVINATTMLPWWAYHRLPKELYKKLHENGIAPLVPVFLTLTHKLMQAVRDSELDVPVVSCCFPDLVNPMLGKIGLAPTVGGGNHVLLVPELRRIVSEEMNVSMRNVAVYMVSHHGILSRFMQAPFWLKILVDDKDVGERFPPDRVRDLLEPSVRRLLGGGKEWKVPPNADIASSFLTAVLAIYFDTGALCHVTGPLGLPGGYPIHLSLDSVELALPEGLSQDEAVRIAEEAGRVGDGVDKIENDGTLIPTDESAAAHKEVLGIDCKEIRVEECEERAQELIAAFKRIGTD